MRRAFPLVLLLFAASASAQSFHFFEAETDKAVYAPGDPIVVTVSTTNPMAEDVSYWFSSGCLVTFVLNGEALTGTPCSLQEVPVDVEAGFRWEGDATIYPDSSGIPASGGMHTLTVRPNVSTVGSRENPSYRYPEEFRLDDVSLTFEAPSADPGVVAVRYPIGTPPSTFDDLRNALNAEVLREESDADSRSETWHVSGAPLASIVEANAEDERFTSFEVADEYQWLYVESTRVVVSSESPLPAGWNLQALRSPCRTDCHVALDSPGAPASRAVVLDALGREVAVLHDGPLAPGTTRWRLPSQVTSGVYIVRVQTPEGSATLPVTVAQ